MLIKKEKGGKKKPLLKKIILKKKFSIFIKKMKLEINIL